MEHRTDLWLKGRSNHSPWPHTTYNVPSCQVRPMKAPDSDFLLLLAVPRLACGATCEMSNRFLRFSIILYWFLAFPIDFNVFPRFCLDLLYGVLPFLLVGVTIPCSRGGPGHLARCTCRFRDRDWVYFYSYVYVDVYVYSVVFL